MSERRACKATGFCRMTVRYQTMRMDDGALRERMKAMAHERRRFGYRRQSSPCAWGAAGGCGCGVCASAWEASPLMITLASTVRRRMASSRNGGVHLLLLLAGACRAA